MQTQWWAAAASILAISGLPAGAVSAADVRIAFHKVSATGVGESIGTIVISEKANGLSLKIDVTGIPAGPHGFHVHENGSCEPGLKDGQPQAALSAGAHYDPAGTKSHKGPEGKGHKGDLPVLTATDKGVNAVVTVDHVNLADVRGRALIIHAGGDTYSDTPENGGGKARIACGVVPKE
jgi:Cu-Zn family superoxide dismutase